VLHSLSFVDDPTRVLRAVRFEQRLNFTIEPRTLELIQGALPMLRRITGERVRNELSLILAETAPEKGLNRLRELGALEAIHPAFLISQPLEGVFQQVRRDYPGLVARFGSLKLPSQADLGWYVLTSRLEPDAMRLVANRLLFSQHRERSFVDAARLLKTPKVLAQADSAPSVIDAFLNPYGEEPLLAVYLLSEDDTVRGHLADYLLRWRAVRPAIDGNMLKALGLKPGPRFRRILDHLRAARLDGLVTNDEEEHALLVTILDAADFQ
jgi:tRNA nucleotidyltransferase (CCA-adding enzyme)